MDIEQLKDERTQEHKNTWIIWVNAKNELRRSMKTLKTIILIEFSILMALVIVGCNPEQIISDPNVVSQIESVAEQGVTLTQTLGLIWPALLPIGGVAGGILGAYKRLKPKIKAAQDETNKCQAGGEVLADILEDVKNNEPDMWKKIGPQIAEASKISGNVSDAIRGFRGI